MPLDPATPLPVVMCLTQDGLTLSHAEQVHRLCAAGAGWIQLRVKNAAPDDWLKIARTVVAICREHGARCIINDNVDIALAAEADGVHLGSLDEAWAPARRRLGPGRILGGTINHADDARRAVAAGCLDYVGVGPWRFTTNKKNLAPVLGPEGVRNLVAQLPGLPAWVIGGIAPADLPAVRATGAAGAAVSSALFRAGTVEDNYRAHVAAWAAGANPSRS
jgi:thiamine-phosphate pyrophosphorylase